MNSQIILGIIIMLLVILYSLYKINSKGLRGATIEFIVAAEKEFKKGENSEKMNYVYNSLISLLPLPIRPFITKQLLINFIQKIFDEIKVALDATPSQEKGE